MKIGIVTQRLKNNYGAFLQAWALQEKLRKMGHEPRTIDYLRGATPWYKLLRSWIITVILRCLGKKRPFYKRQLADERKELFDKFVRKNMSLTHRVHAYKRSLVKQYGFEAVITGSDQVWRPRYNDFLPDMFLRFVKKSRVRKIAYAASFGVDNWEYTPERTNECKCWAKHLDAISVRESSGIALCKEHLGVEAIEALDPTLLHTAEDYEKLCADIPQVAEPYLASYMLDITTEKREFVERVAASQGLPVRIFSADGNAEYSVEQWLAIFRDAQYVVTDSFHGTVFSIIFQKPFLSIVNEKRGACRFHSLLSKFELDNRLFSSLKNISLPKDIDWKLIDDKLYQLRQVSTDFILKALYRQLCR